MSDSKAQNSVFSAGEQRLNAVTERLVREYDNWANSGRDRCRSRSPDLRQRFVDRWERENIERLESGLAHAYDVIEIRVPNKNNFQFGVIGLL